MRKKSKWREILLVYSGKETKKKENESMPHPRAVPLNVSEQQQDVLQRLVHRATSPQRLVRRGKIILAAVAGVSNTKITQDLHVDHETVRLWRERWRTAESRLQAIEATGKPKLLRQAIEALLTDEQRPGAPGIFTFEQFMQIMALACEKPITVDRPAHEMRNEVEAARCSRKCGLTEFIARFGLLCVSASTWRIYGMFVRKQVYAVYLSIQSFPFFCPGEHGMSLKLQGRPWSFSDRIIATYPPVREGNGRRSCS